MLHERKPRARRMFALLWLTFASAAFQIKEVTRNLGQKVYSLQQKRTVRKSPHLVQNRVINPEDGTDGGIHSRKALAHRRKRIS